MIAEAEGPGANVAVLPPAVVESRLTELLAGLGGRHAAACCAGSAGAELPAARVRLERLLALLLPGRPVMVVHDARLVLAAASLDAGVALIAGTGSVAYGRAADGREAQAGGWGWLIGDDGSGAWIAREAVREVMRRADEGRSLGPLGDAMLAACRVSDARELVGALHARGEPREWAELAGVVFDHASTDAGASDVINRAATGLRGLAEVVRARLELEGPVVLAGGLLLNQPELESAVRRELGGRCMRLEQPPVAGAIKLAETLLG